MNSNYRELKELQGDYYRYRTEYQQLKGVIQKKTDAQKKSELLNYSNAKTDFEPSYRPDVNPFHRPQSMNSYDYVSSSLDVYLQQGMNTLKDLQHQHSMFKGIQKRLITAANTLGLSQKVIKWIERRSSQDKLIFYGGALVVILLLLIIFWYL